MKLNIQRSQLYIYMFLLDGFKIFSIFEDMDETDFNFNVDCTKKPSKILVDLEKNTINVTTKLIKKNFYNDFF